MSNGLKNRIQKLESRSPDRHGAVIVTWREGESSDEAIRRHLAQNPQHRRAERFVILQTNVQDEPWEGTGRR